MYESTNDIFYCNFNKEKIIVNLYKSFNVFKKKCAIDLQIENENDINFYIKLNDEIKVEITNQQTYEDNILNETSINEVFCILNNNSKNKNNEQLISGSEEKLLSIIKNLEEKVNKLESNNIMILQKNKELENELSTLKTQFENYKNEIDNKFNNLKVEKRLENINIDEIKSNSTIDELKNQNQILKNEKNKTNIIKVETIAPKELEKDINFYSSKIKNNLDINFYSFEISSITKNLLKKTIDKNKNYIQIKIKLKNNGTIDFPTNCYLKSKSDDNESEFYIKDTIINNGEVVKINQIIDVTISLFFKNENIKNGVYFINFILYNNEIGNIGNEEKIEIPVVNEM